MVRRRRRGRGMGWPRRRGRLFWLPSGRESIMDERGELVGGLLAREEYEGREGIDVP